VTERASSSQGRRSDEDARATRARLLELAGDLFAERGYLQTSIRDLGRHAGVTSGAIYGHFRSKADLLAETINAGTAALLEADTIGLEGESDHVETLTRQAVRAPKRRRLRALIVQGAAAAQTDEETRSRLREEQRAHIDVWVAAFQRDRTRLGIDPSVDVEAALLYIWAAELGLGVLESMGIEPRTNRAWTDIQNRLARSWQLAPDEKRARPLLRRRSTTAALPDASR
jgi:AcrR family transcriptional regulator